MAASAPIAVLSHPAEPGVDEVIVEAREASGLSQRALSERIERAKDFIWKVEADQRTLQIFDLFEVAHALRMTTSELVARLERRLR